MPGVQQHIASLRARFASGNEIQVERAMVPAVEVAAILAHIEALEADAERYRWLRGLDWWAEPEIGLEVDGSAWRVTFSSPAPFENASGGSWLDAAIDAARKEAE